MKTQSAGFVRRAPVPVPQQPQAQQPQVQSPQVREFIMPTEERAQQLFQDLNNLLKTGSFTTQPSVLPTPIPSLGNYEGQQQQASGYVRPPPTSTPSFGNYSGMQQQPSGFVRPPTDMPLPPSSTPSFGNYSGMQQQTGGFVRSPQPSVLPTPIPSLGNYEGQQQQASGYVRPPMSLAFDNNLGGFVPSPSAQPQLAFQLDFNGVPMSMYTDPLSVPPIQSIPTASPLVTFAQEVSQLAEPALYGAQFMVADEYEIKRKLKKLNELHSAGFIQSVQYEDQKGLLEALLSASSLPRKSTKKSTTHRSPGKKRERVIRVFLSSTFRDMQSERDELIKLTFPSLKNFCSKRGIFFTEIDLRWGITAEQAERGEVLELCLQELDKCNYFINMIGNRYGYVPAKIPDNIRQKYPWLPNTDEKDNLKSVTEFEILHGALNPDSHGPDGEKRRALFYTRNCDTTSADYPDRIELLKNKIKQSGFPFRSYDTVKQLADLILEDLKEQIELDFPTGEDPDPLEIENLSHETYADMRSKVYVAKQEYYSTIDRYLANDQSAPLAIVGDSGSGKSSLISNWSKRYEQINGDDGDLVICHFIGSSPTSADYNNLMRRVLRMMKRHFPEIQDEVPQDSSQLIREFKRWICHLVPEGKRLILLLDALNQLEDKDGSHRLPWLPDKIPNPRTKLVVTTTSTLSGSAEPQVTFTEIRKRDWIMMNMQPLDRYEKESLISDYLALFGKSFDALQLQKIVIAPQTKNPLFLRAMLEELRLHGVYEEINQKIEYYLHATTVTELYERVLERLEQDFKPKECPNMVKTAMSLIFVSRRGLSESELLDQLGVSRLIFSPFFFAIQESLVSHGGLYNFFHDYLRQAVESRYLSTTGAKREWQQKLAQYFMKLPGSERKADELPWLLMNLQNWPQLAQALADIDIFLALYTKSRKYELKRYWLSVSAVTDIPTSLSKVLDHAKSRSFSQQEVASTMLKVGRFLREMIFYDPAEKHIKTAVALHLKLYGQGHIKVAKALYLLSELYWNQGKWDLAEPVCIQALQIREKLLGPNHLDVAMALVGLGEMQMRKDSHDEAKKMIERALKIRISHFGPDHPLVARCLQDLAVIADTLGQSDRAIELCTRALEVREKSLGPGHPHVATSLETLASIYKLKGDSSKAEPCIRRALEINLNIHGDYHPSVASCYEWLHIILKDLNRYDEAMEFKALSERLQQSLGPIGERIAD